MAAIFDVDGVLLRDGTETFFRWANSQGHGWCYQTYVSQGNDWKKATGGLGTEQINPVYAEFSTSCLEQLHCPVPGAQVAMQRLNGYPRHVATARPQDLQEYTSERLREAFGHFHGYNFGVKEEKASVVARCNGRFFIDDSAFECQLVKEANPAVEVILFPMRYRHEATSIPGVRCLRAEKRVKKGIDDNDWDEVCEDSWKETIEIILNESKQGA